LCYYYWEEVSDSQASKQAKRLAIVHHLLQPWWQSTQRLTPANSSLRTIYDVFNDRTEHFFMRHSSSVSSTTQDKKEFISPPNADSPKKAFDNQYSPMNLLDCRLNSMFQEPVVQPAYADTRLTMQTAG
jgi:hypothetical protein